MALWVCAQAPVVSGALRVRAVPELVLLPDPRQPVVLLAKLVSVLPARPLANSMANPLANPVALAVQLLLACLV